MIYNFLASLSTSRGVVLYVVLFFLLFGERMEHRSIHTLAASTPFINLDKTHFFTLSLLTTSPNPKRRDKAEQHSHIVEPISPETRLLQLLIWQERPESSLLSLRKKLSQIGEHINIVFFPKLVY